MARRCCVVAFFSFHPNNVDVLLTFTRRINRGSNTHPTGILTIINTILWFYPDGGYGEDKEGMVDGGITIRLVNLKGTVCFFGGSEKRKFRKKAIIRSVFSR